MRVQVDINAHFEDFIRDWRKKFYFAVGGYGSSKSYHTAMKILIKLMQEKRKALVIREVYDTHKDSTFSLFTEIIELWGMLDDSGRGRIKKGKIRTKESPYEIRFWNGSKIIFKGMDKPQKLKSINDISLIWLEECSEVKYAGFKELLGRLRHRTLKLHMILSTNPVSEDNWTFLHFFKDDESGRFVLDDEELYEKRVVETEDAYYHHSVADDNKFLPEDYIKQLEEMKEYDPDLYRVARLGRFGINGTRVLPQFEVMPHDEVMAAINALKKPVYKNGLDFGFVDSYNALSCMAIDHENKYLYIYDEYYTRGITDDVLAEDLEPYRKLLITADNASASTIAYLRQKKFRIIKSKKGGGSRLQSTKKVKRFKRIICSDKCINHIRELKNLTFAKDRKDKLIEDEFNIDPHTLVA